MTFCSSANSRDEWKCKLCIYNLFLIYCNAHHNHHQSNAHDSKTHVIKLTTFQKNAHNIVQAEHTIRHSYVWVKIYRCQINPQCFREILTECIRMHNGDCVQLFWIRASYSQSVVVALCAYVEHTCHFVFLAWKELRNRPENQMSQFGAPPHNLISSFKALLPAHMKERRGGKKVRKKESMTEEEAGKKRQIPTCTKF